MRIITLTTDLGTKDGYLASVKGSIYSQLKEVNIIDISNNIEPFNIQQAAYILRSSYKDFPNGTIHIVSVDDELTITNEHVAVKANEHYFIGADNGLFPLIFNDIKPEKIVRLNISLTSNCMTFASKNIFIPAACHLARGGTMEIIGSIINDFETNKIELKSVIQNNMIRGSVIYIDRYGNAITNINKKNLSKFKRKRFYNSFL